MTISKKPIMELEPYTEEYGWNEFMLSLGAIIKHRFKTGYVWCKAENIGWQHRSGYKVFKCDIERPEDEIAADFLNNFTPACEWSARVHSFNRGKGLYFIVSHHDAPTGESYYLTPIGERTYERLS